MARPTEESNIPATPAIGIVLIILGAMLLLPGFLDLDQLVGIGAIVIGVLVLLGEFA